MRSTTLENLKNIILGLGTYFFPGNVLSKKKCAMRHGFKLRRCASRVIDFNDYLDVFPGDKASGNVFETELNVILLNIIPNICSRQACVQGVYYESIT